jgi:hypothetical protein
MRIDEMKLTAIGYHRNGVAGNGFWVVLFRWLDSERVYHEMVATVFSEPGNVAVLDTYKTVNGEITYEEGNRWDGAHFEPWLRKQIEAREEHPGHQGTPGHRGVPAA